MRRRTTERKIEESAMSRPASDCSNCNTSAFWLEFGMRAGLTKPGDERSLLKEANELVAIFMQGRKTTRNKLA